MNLVLPVILSSVFVILNLFLVILNEVKDLHCIIMERLYSIYIMASESAVLYIGVTNNLIRRVQEHKKGSIESFSRRYGCTKLVYYESGNSIFDAIAREKELKGWIRKKKVALIKSLNPHWKDLYDEILS